MGAIAIFKKEVVAIFMATNATNIANELMYYMTIGKVLNWFRPYLIIATSMYTLLITQVTALRTSKVKYQSELKAIITGVPQGRFLGPPLFLCYVNGMNNCKSFLVQIN